MNCSNIVHTMLYSSQGSYEAPDLRQRLNHPRAIVFLVTIASLPGLLFSSMHAHGSREKEGLGTRLVSYQPITASGLGHTLYYVPKINSISPPPFITGSYQTLCQLAMATCRTQVTDHLNGCSNLMPTSSYCQRLGLGLVLKTKLFVVKQVLHWISLRWGFFPKWCHSSQHDTLIQSTYPAPHGSCVCVCRDTNLITLPSNTQHSRSQVDIIKFVPPMTGIMF